MHDIEHYTNQLHLIYEVDVPKYIFDFIIIA